MLELRKVRALKRLIIIGNRYDYTLVVVHRNVRGRVAARQYYLNPNGPSIRRAHRLALACKDAVYASFHQSVPTRVDWPALSNRPAPSESESAIARGNLILIGGKPDEHSWKRT